MKIVILGAGVSGLSFYLFLEKLGITKSHEIIIYESRDASRASLDQPLGLNLDQAGPSKDADSGSAQIYDASKIGGALGLAANGLGVVKRLDPAIYDELMRTGHVTKRWRLSNARGWTLSDIRMIGKDDEGVMVLREEFWRILRHRVPEGVIRRGKVVGLEVGKGVLRRW